MLKQYGCRLQKACAQDAVDVLELEIASFPEDEAADMSKIENRIKEANDFFWIARNSGSKLIGFVNGTCIMEDHIPHSSMSSHSPLGKTCVIHSVTVLESYRRKGFGEAMLRDYISLIDSNKSAEVLLLLCKAAMIPFYVRCGFSLVGLSSVSHGLDNWFEMKLVIKECDQLQIDAFTSKPFCGGPAAVVFKFADESWMQNVAFENNFPETAFVSPRPEIDLVNDFDIRWYVIYIALRFELLQWYHMRIAV